MGQNILDYMHVLCMYQPTLLPYVVRTLPHGMDASEGGQKKSKKQKNYASTVTPRTPRSSTPTFDLIAIEDMLKRSTATASPTLEEKEMLHSQTELHVTQSIKELYETLKIEKELGIATDETLAAIKKTEREIKVFVNYYLNLINFCFLNIINLFSNYCKKNILVAHIRSVTAQVLSSHEVLMFRDHDAG